MRKVPNLADEADVSHSFRSWDGRHGSRGFRSVYNRVPVVSLIHLQYESIPQSGGQSSRG